METAFGFKCSCCSDWHEGLPDLAYQAPYYWDNAKEAQNPADNKLGSDFCVVDGKHFFIRCVLDVPIVGSDAVLGWGVWVSQSSENFRLYVDTYEATPERVTFGYLANWLSDYPDTLSMHTHVRWRSGGQRPWVELKPCDHALYKDWSKGITRERAIAFAEKALHPTM
jgi:hypothetical protein